MMLKELLSELGVLRLAIFMASMPISRMISCQNMLMFAPPSISVNLNTSGIRSGIAVEPEPHRRQKLRQQEDQDADDPQICADQRREVIVLRLLDKIHERHRQQHEPRENYP